MISELTSSDAIDPGDLPVTVGWLLTCSHAPRPLRPMYTDWPPTEFISTGLAVNMRLVPLHKKCDQHGKCYIDKFLSRVVLFSLFNNFRGH